VSAVHGFAGPGRVTPKSVDRDGNANLVAAAKTAGADVVLMSVAGAAPDHAMELFRMKAAAESNLCASGVRWTVVRASAFLELYLELLYRSAGKSGRPMVFGRGDNPINFVTATEVADAVVGAVLDPSVRGRVVEVVGPRDLTLNELAAICQRDRATVGRGTMDRATVGKGPRHLPRAALRVLAASRFVIASAPARQAHAALIMDSTDMTGASHADRAVSSATGPEGAAASGQ